MSRVGLGKVVFGTSDLAKICQVAQNTVIKWMDAGLLPSFRVPTLSKRITRRVTRKALVKFLKEHGMDFALEELGEVSQGDRT